MRGKRRLFIRSHAWLAKTMTRVTILALSALWWVACGSPQLARPVLRKQSEVAVHDTAEYRRRCFVPPGSKPDLSKPCELRDQGVRIP